MKGFHLGVVLLTLLTKHVQSSAVVDCADSNVGRLVADDSDCSIYWLCGDGYSSQYQCPSGQQFNPDKEDCDQAGNSGCNLSSSTSPAPQPTSQRTTSSSAPQPTTQRSTSPAPQPTTQRSTSTTNSSVFNDREICRQATANKFHLPHPRDKTKFVKCDLNTGRGTIFNCPNGLEFNASIQVCDWPSS